MSADLDQRVRAVAEAAEIIRVQQERLDVLLTKWRHTMRWHARAYFVLSLVIAASTLYNIFREAGR